MIAQLEEALEQTVDQRIFYSQNNSVKGVTLICIGGIHGNEPAGVKGLQKVVNELKAKHITCNGNFYAILGNIKALKKQIRYNDYDLNRLWTKEEVKELTKDANFEFEEQKEQKELYDAIKSICETHQGKFVFIDLHTTSSPTIPFITISDSLNNRTLAKQFHLPIVLGIEEYLEGPLLSFINEFGHIALGFESGQHDDMNSILNSEAFIWLMLYNLRLINNKAFDYKRYEALLQFENGFYEIIYRHNLSPIHQFKMKPGFKNFSHVMKHQLIANDKLNEIKSPFSGLIFMPLYQKQGEDGFFIVRKLSRFWLTLSTIMRYLKLHKVLSVLPGISAHPQNEYCLIANKKVALILTTKIFHLFGYRRKIIVGDTIQFIKRDRKVTAFI